MVRNIDVRDFMEKNHRESSNSTWKKSSCITEFIRNGTAHLERIIGVGDCFLFLGN